MASILGNELFQGDLVYLDAITPDDLPLLTEMWQDISYQRHLSRWLSRPATLAWMQEWYEHSQKEDTPMFGIRTREGQRLIGSCGFKDLRWQSGHTFFWIGIGDPAMRGHGYGSDATRILLKYAFLEMGLHCVGLEVLGYNTPAIRAYEKIGFRHDGSARAYIYRDGQYYDMHFMSMLRDEWEARYGEAARQPNPQQIENQ